MSRAARSEDTRSRLIEGGMALFGQRGYNATGIKDITDAAGVPKGSFYNYFASKEDFGVQIIRSYAELYAGAWSASMASAPAAPLAALRHVYQRFADHHARCEHRSGCLLGNLAAEISESSALCREMLGKVTAAWNRQLADMLRQGQLDGSIRSDLSAEQMAGFFWSGWQGALLRMKIEQSIEPLQMCIDLMFDHFFPPQTLAAGAQTRAA